MPCCWDSSSASQNDIWHKMKNFKGIIYAALSSSTFGLAPLFSILLLSDGFSSFEVLSYRWGVASLTLGIIGLAGGCRFRISRQELCTVFFLSLFRAATSLSLVIAYQNISSGVASIIHFMYPLAVALAMALFSANVSRGERQRPSAFRWPVSPSSLPEESAAGAEIPRRGPLLPPFRYSPMPAISSAYARAARRRSNRPP